MAVSLDQWNVEALGRKLTAKQFIGWSAYAQLEPFDETRADVRAAQIVAMIFNMAVAVKDRKPLKDFVLEFGKEQEQEQEVKAAPQQTAATQWEILQLLAAMHATNPVIKQ